eukprot:gene7549-11872_t
MAKFTFKNYYYIAEEKKEKIPFFGIAGTSKERTFMFIKPDSRERCSIGEIIQVIETRGFKIVGIKFIEPSVDLIKEHYIEHDGKWWYQELVSFFSGHGPVVCLVLEGSDVIKSTRKMMGHANPLTSEPGTIRGNHGYHFARGNVIHGADSPEAAEREIKLWFKENEIIDYKMDIYKILNE